MLNITLPRNEKSNRSCSIYETTHVVIVVSISEAERDMIEESKQHSTANAMPIDQSIKRSDRLLSYVKFFSKVSCGRENLYLLTSF